MKRSMRSVCRNIGKKRIPIGTRFIGKLDRSVKIYVGTVALGLDLITVVKEDGIGISSAILARF